MCYAICIVVGESLHLKLVYHTIWHGQLWQVFALHEYILVIVGVVKY